MRSLFIDPYSFPYTYCAGCEKHFHFRQFVWVDSGENLSAFVKRIRLQKSTAFKLCRLVVGPIFGAVAGAMIGWYFGGVFGLCVGVAAGMAGGWFGSGLVCELIKG
jgi:hypothetical protein